MDHRSGNVAQQHQLLAAVSFFLILQPVKAAAGFQPLADGFAEIQLAAVSVFVSLGGKLSVELPGQRLDNGNCLGDIRILKFGNIPV